MTQGWFSEAVTLENRRTFWVQVFARLKPGETPETAQASLQPPFRAMIEMETRGPGFESAGTEARDAFLRSTIEVEPGAQGRTSLRESYEMPLKVLAAIVGIVLLIACANVANLLLERATGRQREIAVRMALGARTGHIVRHALVESVLLALLGGAAGLLLAAWTTDVLVGFVPTDEARVNLVTTPDWRILLFTLATCLATGVLFGLAPALASGRVDPVPTLKQEARGIAGGQRWLRTSLVIAQVSLSLVLVIGAGQFLRTLLNLRRVDAGLRTGNVIVFSVNPSLNGYDKPRSREFYRGLLDRLRALPGADAVGASAIRVLDDDWWGGVVTVDGEPPPNNPASTSFNLVSPGYLSALGTPILSGRDFSPADAARKERVALVNESFVRRYLQRPFSESGAASRSGPPAPPPTSRSSAS